MSEEDFNGLLLSEKLAKLNSSQQCIESLSRWCITHRKKAKQIVEAWDKLFKSAKHEQRVSFLFLANDILQNSRRKGSEFVNEFWKCLPTSLKRVYDNGDENGKKVASRLVDIWEERKVFGSRGQNLKDEILGKIPPAVSIGKSSNTMKVIKRDSQALRIKLPVGGLPEKIVSAFQLVVAENDNEESALTKCRGAVSSVKEMERDIESSSLQGNLQASEWLDKIQEQENMLRQSIGQLENSETTRVALVSQLKEALQDQESKLELVRSEMQVARVQIEQALYVKQRLTSSPVLPPQPIAVNQLMDAAWVAEANMPSTQLTSTPMLPPPHPPTFAAPKMTEEESKKAAAAAVAAKLAASTSSAQMLTSVLSSLVAEEAASLSSGLNSAGFLSSLPFGSPEKRLKLEKAASYSDMNRSDGNHSMFFASAQQQPVTLAPSVGMQLISQGNQMQSPFPQPPPPPPLLANSPATQVGQSAAMMMGVSSYGYGAGNLPPPPLPSHLQMAFARPAPHQQTPQQQLQSQQPQQQQQQQPPTNGGYYRPPGIGFYGQNHQPATPPVPRQ